ncbi:hypothetical protein [Vibrio parahaemolyticus]|uniref:hypothetical protein n=1 Tax=Vibrio parahaemolyticus TaxID=670 RepID=UPI0009CA4270|nr:hypothetical protein [Vibrio parahaemolyticus]OQK18863.1 hypothetical protein XE88_u0039 [Vibrio parahaemolyticus]
MSFKMSGAQRQNQFIIQLKVRSVAFCSYDTPEKVLTIAKWNTREDWELFWGNRNPEKMQQMRKIAERVSVEAFNEIEDRTK